MTQEKQNKSSWEDIEVEVKEGSGERTFQFLKFKNGVRFIFQFIEFNGIAYVKEKDGQEPEIIYNGNPTIDVFIHKDDKGVETSRDESTRHYFRLKLLTFKPTTKNKKFNPIVETYLSGLELDFDTIVKLPPTAGFNKFKEFSIANELSNMKEDAYSFGIERKIPTRADGKPDYPRTEYIFTLGGS